MQKLPSRCQFQKQLRKLILALSDKNICWNFCAVEQMRCIWDPLLKQKHLSKALAITRQLLQESCGEGDIWSEKGMFSLLFMPA